MLADAAEGAVFGELLTAVMEVKDKAIIFKPTLDTLQSTLISIAPVLIDMERLSNELERPKEELESVIRQMEEGKKLVYECSKIHRLNYVARVRYQNQLVTLVDSLVRVFIINMQAQTARDQKETLLKPGDLIESEINESEYEDAVSDNSDVEEASRSLFWDSDDPVPIDVNESNIPFSTQPSENASGTSAEHHVRQCFALDKLNGKKCYMLPARSLFIAGGDTPSYWRWTSVPAARVSEVAELVIVCWLEIKGRIKTRILSPNTLYTAYLVFKQSSAGAYGFKNQPVEVSVGVVGC
ncbi:putative F-box protein PP2-B12 [Spatholobus suberectus]|nr:putative F-box protein PP2-B12 [Spatholobus suberectus]